MVKIFGPLGSHDASGSLRAPPIFSSSLRNRQDREAPPVPPPPLFDYVVTGVITPDATGNYIEDGTWNGYPCYRRQDSAYWIWTNVPPPYWIISTTKGDYEENWYKPHPEITGDYQPWSTHTGIATVSAP